MPRPNASPELREGLLDALTYILADELVSHGLPDIRADTVALKTVRRLGDHYGAQMIYIPKGYAGMPADEGSERVWELFHNRGMRVAAIAAELNCTRQNVYRLLRAARRARGLSIGAPGQTFKR